MDKKKYLKIFLAMLGGFVLSWFFANNIFLSQSPRIRKNLKENLIAQILKLKLPSLQTGGRGIYARNEANLSYVLIKENEVEWKVYEFDIRGQKIKIKVPKDEKPPSQEVVEKIL